MISHRSMYISMSLVNHVRSSIKTVSDQLVRMYSSSDTCKQAEGGLFRTYN
jgi:hypothetical protein